MKKINRFLFPILFFGVIFVFFFYADIKSVLAENETSYLSRPSEVIINERSDRVFILNQESNNITVFDTKNNEFLANIPVGLNNPMRMKAFGNDIYIIDELKNLMKFPGLLELNQYTIEGITKKRVMIETDQFPMDFNKDTNLQKIFITNVGSNKLSVFDESNLKMEKVEMIVNSPGKVFINEKANHVYILDKSGFICVVDGKSNEVLKMVQFSDRPYYFDAVMSSVGDRIFISSVKSENQELSIFDVESERIVFIINDLSGQFFNIAFNNQSNKLYLSNLFDSTVAVFDAKNYKMIKTVYLRAGSSPKAMSIDEVNNFIFILNSGLHSVSIIDGRTDELFDVINTGHTPVRPFASKEGGIVFVPNYYSNSLTVIFKGDDSKFNEKTFPEQKGIVSIGNNFAYPFSLAVNDSKNEVYVLNNIGGSFLIIDSKNYKIKNKINVGQNPRSIIFSPELNKVFVSVGGENKVVVYNVTDGSQKSIEVGTKPANLLLDYPNKKLYAVNFGSYDVSVIDVSNDSRVVDIPIGSRVEGIAINLKEDKLYVAGVAKGELIIINTEANKVAERIKLSDYPRYLSFDNFSNKLYLVDSTEGNVTVIDGSTNKILKRISDISNPSIFYPNYNFLTFDSLRNKIYIPGAGIAVIDSKNEEVSSLENISIIGYPVKTFIDIAKKNLYVLTTQGGVNIIDIEQNIIKNSFNIFEQSSKFLDLRLRGSVGEVALSEKNKKAFILLDDSDIVAIIDTKTDKLDAVISNFGVKRLSVNVWGMVWSIGGIVIVVGLVTFFLWKFLQKPKFRKAE